MIGLPIGMLLAPLAAQQLGGQTTPLICAIATASATLAVASRGSLRGPTARA